MLTKKDMRTVMFDFHERIAEITKRYNDACIKLHDKMKELEVNIKPVTLQHMQRKKVPVEKIEALRGLIEDRDKLKKERISVLGSVPEKYTKKSVKYNPSREVWDDEMSHFGKYRGKKVGYGLMSDYDYEGFQNDLSGWVHLAKEEVDEPCVTKLYSEDLTATSPFLYKSKSDMIEFYKDFRKSFMSSRLARTLEFISRFSFTLYKLSTLPLSKHYYTFDNLGYNNVLMIVRGGK
jgi:hypothetical protein